MEDVVDRRVDQEGKMMKRRAGRSRERGASDTGRLSERGCKGDSDCERRFRIGRLDTT